MMMQISPPALGRFLVSPLLAAAVLGIAPKSALAQFCGCTGSITTYCTAGTSVQGCLPSISGTGYPSVLAPSGFDIVVNSVPGQRSGTIFYGFYSYITPWAPGSPSFKCVANPVQRTYNLFTGGAASQCNGELRVDFNAWMATHPAALGGPFVQGQTIRAQGWYRDPSAPGQTNLSDAVTFTLCGTATSCPPPPGFVAIQPGTFQMGSNAASGAPYQGGPNEWPFHQVTISYGYWIGATEVTQAQYQALMGSNPSSFPGPNNPVENVTWFSAQAYCAAFTAQQSALGNLPPGYQYRLPTEAEWEYACRAGTTTEFNVGNALYCNQARFYESYHTGLQCYVSGPGPVSNYSPNAWGLYDMHGNVFEWCLDSFASYSASPVTDPYVTGGTQRVIRGGGWHWASDGCRSAKRLAQDPTAAYFGFRVVLAPVLVP